MGGAMHGNGLEAAQPRRPAAAACSPRAKRAPKSPEAHHTLQHAATPTSSTGALNEASTLCRVAGASEEEQERMARSGGGVAAG